MNDVIYDVKLPYRTYCNLPGCGKPVYHVFRTNIDGTVCTFCSPDHLREGEHNWEEKKKLHVRLGVPPKPEEPYESGNIPGSEGGE